jgi:hypothetical protein
MLIQLDAAQVIDLIDGDDELRELLRGHQCAVSSSVVLDLTRKIDRPAENYYAAFTGLTVLWSMDGGMVCNAEIESGVRILAEGRDTRTKLERNFPFRTSILDAISVRIGEAVPPQFASKGFGDLMTDPLARLIMQGVTSTYGAVHMDYWRASLETTVAAEGHDLRTSLRRRAEALSCDPELRSNLDNAPLDTLRQVFPAYSLNGELRHIYRSDGKSKWTDNDIVDIFHVIISPYCDVMFCDGSMHRRLDRLQKTFRVRPTRYILNAQTKDFLRKNESAP